MKVCVYAISKNEEKFVERWYNSVKEADEVYVLDTGSKDKTVKLLRKLGVNVVRKKIKPFRFDVARNMSLELVPADTDICVCCDLDEVFESGWRDELEKNWNEDINRVSYNYNWKLDKNNKPMVSFYLDKIHSRDNYKWTHPVHEVLTYTGKIEEKKILIDTITLNHYPDNNKSRDSYLPLLELSVKEDPNDDRNMHYLGREYMYYDMWNEAIDTLIKHLALPTSTWNDERCASMRFISRCYGYMGRFEEAKMWVDKAILEAPYLRDPYLEKAILYYQLKDWEEVKKNCLLALNIKEHKKTYINEVFSWDTTVYELIAISDYYLSNYEEALVYINIALDMKPGDERILGNKKFIEEKLA